jgi:type II secretory pathway component GspD/PulD (secretin)
MKTAIRLFVFIYFLSNIFPGLAAAQEVPLLDSKTTISMDLQDASLKDILKLLSQQSGLNFIASKAVQDRDITLYLDNVPIKEAMDKLFNANNLSYELDKKANIFIIKDWGEPQIETITKVFPLKYASVSSSSLRKELTNILSSDTSSGDNDSQSGSSSTSSSAGGTSSQKSTSTSSGTTEQTSLVDVIKKILSSYGSVVEDARTNSLIITEIPSRMPVIERTLAALDVPIAQVLIEVEMLDVSKDDVDQLGVKFGQTPITLNTVWQGASATSKFPFGSFFNTEDTVTKGLFGINTGTASSPVSTYKIMLDFLKTRTDTKYLARPKILTLNNETAEIRITTNESIGIKNSSSTSSGGLTSDTSGDPERADTGVLLRVTPQVSVDTGEITLFIYPEVKEATAGNLLTAASKNYQFRDVETRSTKSSVRIKDGETVILGGMIRNEYQLVTTKLPILGDIPILGALFRHKDLKKNKERELLVFITPRIVKEADKSKLAQIEQAATSGREQNTVSTSERYAAINTSLNTFEKKKK